MLKPKKQSVVKKKKPNYLKLLSERVRLCPAMKRCDGAHLAPGKEICGPCAKAIAPRRTPRLKGTSVTDTRSGK